jgi:peptidoglycan/xylan/chitin deacetylase (PgdA/CDA1 family)
VTSGRAILYASTIGAVGLGVKSAMMPGVLPIQVAAGAAVGFASVIMAGVLEPRLGMFAEVLNRGDENPEAPRVALTFDDGPSPATTPQVLDLLEESGAKATFFAIGKKLTGEGKTLARRARDAGHAIACHGFAHDRFFALRGHQRVRDDLLAALAAIEDATGARTTLFRPPIGHTNPTIARVAEELGLTIVGFSVRGYDGTAAARAERVRRRVIGGLEDGAIVLLHDGAERDDVTPTILDVLPDVLAAMKAKNLAGVTVDAFVDTE